MKSLTVMNSALSALLLLSACATVSDIDNQASYRAEQSLPEVPSSWAWQDADAGHLRSAWLDEYQDPVLNELVREAQLQNRDLQIAAASVDRAWALARQAGAALSPQLNASGETIGQGIPDDGSDGLGALGLQASWEVDLWGRIGSGRDASIASAEAVEADVYFARQSLTASVATAYFLSIEGEEQEALAQSNVDSLREIERITKVRADNGLATAQDVSLASSDLAASEDRLITISHAKRSARRALEVLLGRYPDARFETTLYLPEVPPPPPVGLPSEMLERRPDIFAAERRIASTISGVNVARAAKLPRLNLTVGVNTASSDLTDLLDPSNVSWQAASSLLVPILNGGALDAEIEIASAEGKAAIADYAAVALAAFQDVEDALDATSTLTVQAHSLNTAAREAQEALRLARIRYEEGETDLIDVLSIQQRVNSTRSNEIAIHRQRLVNFATLNLSLGGSWKGL